MQEELTHMRSQIAQLRNHERELLEQLRKHGPVTRNVNIEEEERLSTGDRIADRVASMVGSWRFIIIQSSLLIGWIILNITAWIHHWDPYPFILLNLVLSFQAAYTAPIIMMSANRQADKDRLQAEFDYKTNIKAELEIEELHNKLDLLRVKQWDELVVLQQRQISLLEQLTATLNGDKT